MGKVNLKSKKFIGFVVVMILWTGAYFIELNILPEDGKGFWRFLMIPMYLVVMVGYIGILETYDFIREMTLPEKSSPEQRLSVKNLFRKHYFAILFLLFILLGMLGLWG